MFHAANICQLLIQQEVKIIPNVVSYYFLVNFIGKKHILKEKNPVLISPVSPSLLTLLACSRQSLHPCSPRPTGGRFLQLLRKKQRRQCGKGGNTLIQIILDQRIWGKCYESLTK